MKKRIAVLMGGWGEEREVSFKSGAAALRALKQLGYPAVPVVAGPGLDQVLRCAGADVAFLALHGRMGEDGRVQGLCEVLGIPYTGSGVLASALAMNKPVAKQLLRLHNLATPPGYVAGEGESDLLARHGDLGFPCVVKPARGGSSVGLSRVTSVDSLAAAVSEACKFGDSALVERQVLGAEVTVAVLDGRVLGSCEVEHRGALFDYAAKYRARNRYRLPPRLSAVRVANVETLAQRAYHALGCRGAARVDFICSPTDNEVLLEVNTLPGLTPQSLLLKIAQHAGLGFTGLVEALVAGAALDDLGGVATAPGGLIQAIG